ncbi:MAG TPA: hypothetical protein VGU45_07925 [Microvirga sp.]|nr:hypothetical protein [Microvirga sp.]
MLLSAGLAVAVGAAAIALLPSTDEPKRPQPPSALPPPASARLDQPAPPPPSRPPPPQRELAGDGPVTTGTAVTPPAAAIVQAPPLPSPAPPSRSGPAPELTQAEDHLRRGDVTGARLWLARAAEAGDAEATFRLAETFDAEVLRRWGVVGLGGDPVKAREYYAKAGAAGHAVANERLQRMAR